MKRKIAVCALVSIVFCLFLGACSSDRTPASTAETSSAAAVSADTIDTTEVQEKIKQAQEYVDQQDYTAALELYTEIIALDPEDIPIYLGRAYVYTLLEQYEDACSDYDTAIEKSASIPYLQAQAYYFQANALEELGEKERALSNCALASEALDRVDIESSDNMKDLVELSRTQIDLFTAQLDTPADNRFQELMDGSNTSSVSKPSQSTSSLPTQDLAAAQAKFQEVFEQVHPREYYENQYAGCKRYTLVNDYDGDGSLEAFAFFGVESDWQPAPFWESICLYYIDSDYTVTCLAGDSSGYDSLIGSISCPEPNYKDDFSNCFFESENERYLVWSVTYLEGDWFALVLGVHDGKPVLSYPGSVFYVNDSGQFATMDENYNEIILQLKDGKAIPVS